MDTKLEQMAVKEPEQRHNYSWTEDDNINTGAYDIIEFDRDEVIEKLEMLISLAKKVRAQDYHILHFGI